MTDTPMLPFDDPILAEFRVFDAANPHVWEHFERFTLMAIRAGRTRYSADAILHRIRWHLDVETTSDDGFKANNNWTRCYSRKWAETHPEHAEFFERRAVRAAGPCKQATMIRTVQMVDPDTPEARRCAPLPGTAKPSGQRTRQRAAGTQGCEEVR